MSTEIYPGNPPGGRAEWIIGRATKVKYTAASGLPDWRGNVRGELSRNSIPNVEQAETVDIGLDVTSIGEGAFADCGRLTSATIPDGVTSIGRAAFFGCHRLVNVTIPDSVETIGNSVFTGCGDIEQAFFAGRTLAQVKAIPDADGNWQYPWGLAEDKIVPGIAGDITL